MLSHLRISLKVIGLFFVISLLSNTIMSCSEKADNDEEYADWKVKNDKYWSELYYKTKQRIEAGNKSWDIILNYTYLNQKPISSANAYTPDKYIIVHKLEAGTGKVSPLFTDSVHVHYRGMLIPSKTNVRGFVFDSSWGGNTFDVRTAIPARFRVNNVVDGFSTALQSMHIGDNWEVYIPYSLGYGGRRQGNIPAYSTLIFNIRIESIYHY